MAALALVMVLGVFHLWVAEQWGRIARIGGTTAEEAPARMEVAFVTELKPAAPPAAPAVPAPRPSAVARPPEAAPAPALPASAPLPPPAPELAPDSTPAASDVASPAQDAPPLQLGQTPSPQTLAPEPASPASTPTDGAATTAASSAPLAPSAPAFEWPPSTRLSYLLTGDYRGPVQGRATVEWLTRGERYQVHLEVRVGSDLLPLMTRRMSSDGRITAAGLEPARYDEETRVLMREARRQTIVFEPGRVILPRGGAQPSYAGIQDTASQFVQLTWLLTTQPQRLQVGQTVELPLALARRVDRWTYEVVSQENLDTPMGRIPAWYLRPRPENKTASDLAVETWFAPSLQYLPVRIRIRQDDATFIDLMLERPPQQEAPRRP